ncbi:putative phage holin [Streptomonospora wellingtoniae]|uniref:Holin n=1 Tax=Streptomonospora wellingtoniae TaxID=3075544 RepID=A0ABU2KUC9_9ACTN|nr:hypothetical protein [Streptomonospora sp. DSM 45055]MDT0302889.1 hypothetical protein [Streptomonospora sp. DSM 45055]
MGEVANVLAGLTALLLWVFAADYCRVRPWRNPGGRLVLVVTLTLAVVMSFISARLCFGAFAFHEVVRIVVYGAAMAAVVCVWVAFRRAQSRARARARERGRHRP